MRLLAAAADAGDPAAGALAPALLAAAARLPLEKLPAPPRAALLRALLRLAYHPSPPVRAAAYAAAAAAGRLWTAELADLPLALLFVALGDRHPPNAAAAADALESLLADRGPYAPALAAVRERRAGLAARDDPINPDRVAELLGRGTAGAGDGGPRAAPPHPRIRPAAGRARPALARRRPGGGGGGPGPLAGAGAEERPHLSAWAALLYSKLGATLTVTAEQQRALEGVARAGQPVHPLRLLRPALAHPNPAVRLAACVAVRRACFAADAVNFASLAEAVDILLPSLLATAAAVPATPPTASATSGVPGTPGLLSATTGSAVPPTPRTPAQAPLAAPFASPLALGSPGPGGAGPPSITLSTPAGPGAGAGAERPLDRGLDEPHLAEAALLVFAQLVPFKIRGLNKLVCDQALEPLLMLIEDAGDVAAAAGGLPSASGRRAGPLCARRAIELAEARVYVPPSVFSPFPASKLSFSAQALLLACPAAFTDSIERLRDALRRAIVHAPEEAGRAAERLYPLVFRAATSGGDAELGRSFVGYARGDVQPALDPRWESPADHMLAGLSLPQLRDSRQLPQAEKAEVLEEGPGPAPAATAAARAVWVALPLLADPVGEVRAAWRRYLAGVAGLLDHRAALLPVDAEANDAIVAALSSGARAAPSARGAGAGAGAAGAGGVPPTPRQAGAAALRLAVTAAGFESGLTQTVLPKLVARPEAPGAPFYLAPPPGYELNKEEAGPPPAPNGALLERMQAAVAYHLDCFRALNDPLPGAALLALSELAALLPAAVGPSALQTLLQSAARQLGPATRHQVLPACVGLVNLSRASKELFEEAVGVLGGAAAAAEGQLLALRALVPLLAQVRPAPSRMAFFGKDLA
eukprot:tig00021013_g17062.t1